MQAAGLAEKGRGGVLALTEAGQAVAGRVRAAVADLELDAAARLSETQIAGFHAVVAALQAAS